VPERTSLALCWCEEDFLTGMASAIPRAILLVATIPRSSRWRMQARLWGVMRSHSD
jgi:hypothetical protein